MHLRVATWSYHSPPSHCPKDNRRQINLDADGPDLPVNGMQPPWHQSVPLLPFMSYSPPFCTKLRTHSSASVSVNASSTSSMSPRTSSICALLASCVARSSSSVCSAFSGAFSTCFCLAAIRHHTLLNQYGPFSTWISPWPRCQDQFSSR